MLSFETHPREVTEMRNIINTGKFHSVTFIKADNSIRFANGKKLIYKSNSPDTENRGKWDREGANIITIFDNNKPKLGPDYKPIINPETGRPIMGAPISIRLDRLLYFKSGEFVRDFTEENNEAVVKAKITPEQIQEIRKKMRLAAIVQEEMESMLNESSELLGIPDLAEYLFRVDPTYEQNDMLGLLQQEYQNGGDNGVINYLRKYAGINVDSVGKGKYVFKYGI